MFNPRDYDQIGDDDAVPDGVVDLSYEIAVEARLIEVLREAFEGDLAQTPWLAADVDMLIELWDPPLDHNEDVYTALLLGSTVILSQIIGAIAEDCVSDLLHHLTHFHEEIAPRDERELLILDFWFLFSQIVYFCQPADPTETQHAFMRILDYATDNDDLDNERFLQITRYMLFVAIVVLDGDSRETTLDLLDCAESSNQERAANPIGEVFNDPDDQAA